MYLYAAAAAAVGGHNPADACLFLFFWSELKVRV
jgi:hypothetical protein